MEKTGCARSTSTHTFLLGGGIKKLLVGTMTVLLLTCGMTGCSGSSPDSGDGSSSEQAAMSDSSKSDAFNSSDYQTVDYSKLAKRPDDYKGKKLYFSGKVIQVDESGSTTVVRLATSANGYDDIIWVEIDPSLLDGSHIVEDQTLGVYGTCEGQQTYESVMGSNVSIPALTADRINEDAKSPQQEQNEKITALFKDAKFEKKDDGYGYYTYSATVKNTTDINYKDVSLNVVLYDANGTRIEEDYADVSSWSAGESAVFEASSDKDADTVKAEVSSYSIGDEYYTVDADS